MINKYKFLKKRRFAALAFLPLFFLTFTFIALYYGKTHEAHAQTLILDEIASQSDNHEKQFTSSHAPLVLGTSITTQVQVADGRSANLRYFFRKYNSDLYDYAEDMVAISDKYGFDYRLLAAIAMQESGLCRSIPNNSHNCWGYGIYGDQVMRFDSYPEAMEAVALGLRHDYIDKGLITPELIMQKYTPSSNGSWAYGVTHFLRQLQ